MRHETIFQGEERPSSISLALALLICMLLLSVVFFFLVLLGRVDQNVNSAIPASPQPPVIHGQESQVREREQGIREHVEPDGGVERAIPNRREVMISEVIHVWQMFLRDGGCGPRDKRRKRFRELAEYLVDAVMIYQATETDLGGILPGHFNDHIVVATIVTKESSITPGVKSKSSLGEVCLMQMHGVVLNGNSPSRVRKNPLLCLRLGVRWLASRIQYCPSAARAIEQGTWTDDDWAGPLSLYAGGMQRTIAKSGRCKKFSEAVEKIERVKEYRERIDSRAERDRDGGT